MEKIEESNHSFLNKTFNIVSDKGVQLCGGNTFLFWLGGEVAQTASLAALTGSVVIKASSEFLKNPPELITNDNIPLKVASLSLAAIAANYGLDGEVIPAITSSAFATGNMSVAGSFDKVQNKLSDIFGDVTAKISTQAETFYTVGLGLAAYMAAGDSTVALPFLDQTIPTSMLTFIPTAIGGSLAVKNAVMDDDKNKSKPLLWLAGGVSATAGVGLLGGAILPAVANGFFASAYIKMQADNEGGYKELGNSIKGAGQKLLHRIL